MRKLVALGLFLLGAWAQEVVVYPGFAEVKEPVVLPPSAWVYLAGEKLARMVPGSLRLLGVEEEERLFQGTAVLFRYRGEGRAWLRYLYTGLSGEVFYTSRRAGSPPGPGFGWRGRPSRRNASPFWRGR